MSEVAILREVNQFQPGRSQFMCGFFSSAMASSMAPPGKPPTKTAQEIITDATAWYGQINGDISGANLYGMTLDQLYQVLHGLGLHYQSMTPDETHVRAWLNLGYPVIVAVNEVNVFDDALGRNPYPWGPAGSHVLTLTGLDGSAFLARDSANCSNLYDTGSLRPGPRRYDAQKFSTGLIHATAVVPPWKSRPAAGFDPTNAPAKKAPLRVATVEAAFSTPDHVVPQGWQDTGERLIAPNGLTVTDGFRAWILRGGWDKDNWPLSLSAERNPLQLANPGLGAGTQQVFRLSVLQWTEKLGVFACWVGEELLAERQRGALTDAQWATLAAAQEALSPLWTAYNLLTTALKEK